MTERVHDTPARSARAWQTAGALLLVLAVVPLYRLLRQPATGLAGTATAEMASAAASIITAGALLAVAIGIACARMIHPEQAGNAMHRLGALIMRPGARAFATAVALTGLLAAVLVSFLVFHTQPVLIDAIAQLAHARVIADGHGAAPADTIGFFRLQQSVTVANGWVSQYPPLHILVLAAGVRIGAPWIVGPLMLGVALFFTARAVERLIPGRAAARSGLLLASLSPFMLTHAATYMSHTTAAACIALALYCTARAMTAQNPTGWLLSCGLATGAAFATRPLTGLTVGAAIALALMLRGTMRAGLRDTLLIIAGALPFAIGVALYNNHYFGAPTRFGYDVALGPNAGLGFGTDPWGNAYGLREAIAYTSAELTTLSLQLFETPLPLVAMIGAYLLVRAERTFGERLVLTVALAPVVSGMLYWHHGLFMGPRMLNEYGIVWSVVAVIALAGIFTRLPQQIAGLPTSYSPRSFFIGLYATSFIAALILAPMRFSSYSVPAGNTYNATASLAPGALVFVHGGWGERLSMQLAARGWRLDRVEAALRQNSTCAVQRVVDGGLGVDALDLVPHATSLPKRVEFPIGNPIRVVDGEPWPEQCARQVAADSAGVIDPSALLWRGGAPHKRAVLVARDLGPSINVALVAQHRDAHVLMRGPDGQPVLTEYNTAMRQLWQAGAQ